MSVDPELQVFVDESDELLADMESALLKCEKSEPTGDDINAIFRAAHTIKGSAGLFGLDFIVTFVHEMETVLDRVRVGTCAMRPPLVVALLACGDHVRALVDVLKKGGRETTPGLTTGGNELVRKIRDLAGSAAASVPATADTARAPATPASHSPADTPGGPRVAAAEWYVGLRFGPEVLRNGMDPLSFLRYLATFGELLKVVPVATGLSAGADWDPERCYLAFDLRYRSDADRQRIVDAFEFVRDDCGLEVIEPHSPAAAYLRALQRLDGPAADAARLVAVGILTPAEITAAQQAPKADPRATEGRRKTDAAAGDARTIRIDSAKLDHLITLIGELTITAAGTQLGARRSQDAEMLESASQLATLVEQVRDSALQLRMVRIGATFSRFHRVVNDTARELGKNIRLAVSGEDTELDKTVVEKIGDPLTHLIRNAIDHGIGTPEKRLALGKSEEGTVSLNAYHESGHIVIEVGDDGYGLKHDRILAKAIERGLVPEGAQLSPKEIEALIFEPGFSTAEKVTNVSGRGVGMDVVRRNITALRGTIEVRSVKGVGTTFIIRLPLTLAIINGFQVAIGKTVFVLPLEMVDECIEYTSEPGHDYANVRGKPLPFVRLHEVFGIERRESARQNIVIVSAGGQRAGLVVDGLLGECQTVIKPLSRLFQRVRCVSGSSILGNGEVALILDVPALMERALADSSTPVTNISSTANAVSTVH